MYYGILWLVEQFWCLIQSQPEPFHPWDPITLPTSHIHITSLSYCYFLESLHIQSTSFAWISIHRILSNTKFFFKFIHGKLVCSNSRVHPHEMSPVFRSLDGFLLFNSDKAAFSWPWHITYIIIHGGLNLTLLSPENCPQFQSLISFLW